MAKLFLETISKRQNSEVPIWLMRQAGRYLPEYRALRADAGDFLSLCLTPKWATEITLQPIRRFDLDAAILFADILLIPLALGQKLEFKTGEGPVLDPIENEKDLKALSFDLNKLSTVFETVANVKARLPENVALIGFCGGMFTVACYMIDGTSRNKFAKTKLIAEENPPFLDALCAKLIDASQLYLNRQIEAGAEVVQIFESWAGLLQGEDFKRWVIEPTRELIKRIKSTHPNVPIIGFPREAKDLYRDYADMTGIDVLGIDQHVSLDFAEHQLKPRTILQGNLDPLLLVQGGSAMQESVEEILKKLAPSHIFNLGHGVVPETPPEHVAELIKIVRGHKN